MPKIPQYSRNVEDTTPSLQTPDVRVNIPEAAFGGAVTQAVSNAGTTLKQIGEAILRREAAKSKQRTLEADNNFKESYNNAMYNPEVENYTDDEGNPQTRPMGLLLRTGKQAEGSYAEAQIKKNELFNLYSENLNKTEKNIFQSKMNETAMSYDNALAKHQVKQVRASEEATLVANLELIKNETLSNPTSENLIKNIKIGRGNILAIYGDTENSAILEARTIKASDDMVSTTIKSLLANDNYEQAKVLNEAGKEYISPDLYAKLNVNIDKVEFEQKELQYNEILFATYGLDKEAANDSILSNPNLNDIEKEAQLKSYDYHYNMKREERNVATNIITKDLYNNAEQLYKSEGVRSLNKSLKSVDNSNLSLNEKNNVKSQIRKFYGVDKDFTTSRQTRLNIWNDIDIGEITTPEELLKKYGNLIDDTTFKSISNTLRSSKNSNIYNKFSLSSFGNNLMRENYIPIEEYDIIWEYNSEKMKDEAKKLNRKLTNAEQGAIFEKSLNDVIVKKRFILRDKTIPQYKIPIDVTYDPENNNFYRENLDGSWSKVSKEEVKTWQN